jgi:branched-chain amino acid transport system substrate-binding protein
MNIFRRRLLKSLSLALVAPAPARAQPAKAPIRIALIEGLSGPFGNTGEAVYRNLLWAVERVNARGGVKLPGGHRMLALERYDSKGQNEEGWQRCDRPSTMASSSWCRAIRRQWPPC